MIEKLNGHENKRLLYVDPESGPMYAVLGKDPPNRWEIMDKINEIIDYLNGNEAGRRGEQ